MEDHLHDQHEKKGEKYKQDDSSAFYKGVDNSMGPSKQILTNSKVVEKKTLKQQEPSKDQQLQIKDNLTLSDLRTESLCRGSPKSIEKAMNVRHMSRTASSDKSANAEYYDDDRDVIVRQLQNGCDKTFSDQKQNIFNLPDELENINLNQTSSDKIFKENVPENSGTETTDAIKSTTSTERTIYTSTTTNSSSAMIPLCAQNTIRSRDPENWKCGKDIKDQYVNQKLDEIGDTVCVRGAKRELNKDDVQHHEQSGPQQQLYVEDEPSFRTSTTNFTQDMTNEGLAITRSVSLSSQKTGLALKTQSLESRPIYPNVPYSPYASPYNSPRSNRRRPPLRESRRVSIEQTGSFLQLNQYKLMDQIGQGSYGLVKLAYSEEDSTHYAMKILSKRRLLRQAGLMKRGPRKATSPLDRVYREIAVLKKLDHPNVVKLIEVLDDPLEDSLYMVFELVKQGEVLCVPTKNPLSEERSWSVFRDTILGLEYLHYQRIIHADIKPGNLLLTECGRVKIADLGVCNEFIGEHATMTNGSTAGTPAFRAPESLNEGQNIYCGKAADIWALGATLYALVYGNVPFVASSIPALYEKIKVEELSFPESPKTSVELKDCIQSMLEKHPRDRITLPQLKEHTWVTAGGLHPLPTEEENCRLVQVNDDDINSVVRSIPKLDTLILIKTMLKKHSFGNPFSRGISGRAPQRGGSRLERFIRAGRSNSAPGSYNMIVDRQLSGDNILPALCEHSASSCINEES